MESGLSRGLSAKNSASILAAIALVLSLLGLLMVLSATSVRSLRAGHGLSLFVVKQVATILISSLAGFACMKIGYRRIVGMSRNLVLCIWIGLFAVLLLGAKTYGARRWIDLGFYSLQVSELAKIVVVVATARYVATRGEQITSYFRGLLPAMAWLGVTAILIAVEPDFGTSMFVTALGLLLLFFGGARLSHILITGVVVAPVFVTLMIMKFDHILKRLAGHTDGVHEQVTNSLAVMSKGGILGVGVGVGRAHLSFVPFVESDFIFASVGEQLGLVGTMGVIALFAIFFWQGLKVALRARDQAGFIVAFGLTFMVVFQAGINMAVVTGLIPPKGIGLPFVSYGGSSLLVLAVAVGILASVAREGLDGTQVAAVALGDEDSALRDQDLESLEY